MDLPIGSACVSCHLVANHTPTMVFARQYKTLDCAGCDRVIGFRNRATGEYLCDPAICHREHRDDSCSVVSNTNSAPTTTTGYGSSVASSTSPFAMSLLLETVEKRGTEKLPSDKERVDPPSQTRSVFAQPLKKRIIVDPPHIGYDTVDKNVENKASPKIGPGVSTPHPLFGPKKIMPISQAQAVPMAVAQQKKKTAVSGEQPPPLETRPFMWQNCKYSTNLTDAALVKTTFVWNIHSLQIICDKDEDDLFSYQDKIAEYVKIGQPMTRAPIKDEMVIALYGGDYFRGRVTQVTEGKCSVVFVDFGDALKDLKHKDLFEMDPQLFEVPLYSARVRLSGVKELEKIIKPGKKLSDLIYTSLQLQVVDKIVMGEQDEFEVILWVVDDQTLNNLVSEALAGLERQAQAGQE